MLTTPRYPRILICGFDELRPFAILRKDVKSVIHGFRQETAIASAGVPRYPPSVHSPVVERKRPNEASPGYASLCEKANGKS
jgi:hypothetical protein